MDTEKNINPLIEEALQQVAAGEGEVDYDPNFKLARRCKKCGDNHFNILQVVGGDLWLYECQSCGCRFCALAVPFIP
ncbi:MAG: hypothetical protein Q4E65_02675 [Clostridia bacterium]|nr:hypothetical protein [Clostridia bacterium]